MHLDISIAFAGISYLYACCFYSLSVYPRGLRINLLEAPVFLVCASAYKFVKRNRGGLKHSYNMTEEEREQKNV